LYLRGKGKNLTRAERKSAIGLIAGNRELPLLVAEKARESGRPLAVAAFPGEAEPRLAGLAETFAWIKLGQLTALAEFFEAAGVRDLVMIGGLSRESLFNYEPDEAAAALMAALDDYHTDKILRAVCCWLEERGFRVRAAAELLPELLTPPGLLTRIAPGEELMADLRVAWRVAKDLGRMDVGQCAVVSDRITLAVEAAEGTDEAVRRGASLADKPVAVAKVAKPGQDPRLDPPVIGPETIRVMAETGRVGALVIDSSQVLIVDPLETIRLAEEAGLALLAWAEP
jgi:DUF1009 family protein